VATVILGGLISSTLLDFFVHPALFWCFGRKQAERQMQAAEAEDVLDEARYVARPGRVPGDGAIAEPAMRT
jgi:HME family heavy-metal exporter